MFNWSIWQQKSEDRVKTVLKHQVDLKSTSLALSWRYLSFKWKFMPSHIHLWDRAFAPSSRRVMYIFPCLAAARFTKSTFSTFYQCQISVVADVRLILTLFQIHFFDDRLANVFLMDRHYWINTSKHVSCSQMDMARFEICLFHGSQRDIFARFFPFLYPLALVVYY